ncbi:MAG TPA: transposase [Aggregatilineales bacterium]|nr:transposase [Aggregatilineales bacterium]
MYGLLASTLKVAMKEVKYSRVNQAQTVIASLVMGCGHTKAINEALQPERAAASYLGLERFPDQSPINHYLTRFSEENVKQLGDVQLELLVRQSRARHAVGWLVVDIDQCGLVANGQSYQFKRQGYFPRKRGEEGYQMSAAYLGAYDEAVQVYLDPGNVHCSQRLGDLLRDTVFVLTADNPALKVIYRLDAGYDTPTNRQVLLDRSGYFLLKAHDTRLARKLAEHVPLQDWIPWMTWCRGWNLNPWMASAVCCTNSTCRKGTSNTSWCIPTCLPTSSASSAVSVSTMNVKRLRRSSVNRAMSITSRTCARASSMPFAPSCASCFLLTLSSIGPSKPISPRPT